LAESVLKKIFLFVFYPILNMFLYILPLVILFLCLGVIAIIVVRKFPQLSVLEVEKITEIKQAKVKEDLKKQRFERSLVKKGEKIKEFFKIFNFFYLGWKKVQTSFRQRVFQAQEKYKKISIEEEKDIIPTEKPEEKETIQGLLFKGEEALERGDLSFAERKYIEVLKKDSKNIEAYRGLAKIYMDLDKYKEAEETFKFLLKLNPRDDRAYNRLGMIAEKKGEMEKAIEYFEKAISLDNSLAIRYFDLGRLYAKVGKPALALRNFAKAVDIEPQNPKYLDQLIEISIICRDPEMAKEALARLQEVNPQNQKLENLTERIEEIS